MSKTAPRDADTQTSVVDAPTITLTEFCTRLSETVRRPELISAFHHRARSAGALRETLEAFQARYQEFLNTPV
jgi:hypothetical protein